MKKSILKYIEQNLPGLTADEDPSNRGRIVVAFRKAAQSS